MINKKLSQKVGTRTGAVIALINSVPFIISIILLRDKLFLSSTDGALKSAFNIVLIELFFLIIARAFCSTSFFTYFYSTVYNKLPGSNSFKKGISFGFFYWVIYIIVSYLAITYYEIPNISNYILAAIFVEGALMILFTGMLVSYFWDKYSKKRDFVKKDIRIKFIVVFSILFMVSNSLIYYIIFDTMFTS